MANFNSIFDVILEQNLGQPIVLSSSTQGHFQFKLGQGVAVGSVPNPMASADWTGTFPGRAATGFSFYLRACGLIQYAPNGGKFQIDINQGTGLAPAIATTGVVTTPAVASGLFLDNFQLEIDAMWDSTSGNLRGIQYGWVGANAISQAAIIGSSPASLAALQFNVAVTFLSANVSNQFTLTDFSADFN